MRSLTYYCVFTQDHTCNCALNSTQVRLELLSSRGMEFFQGSFGAADDHCSHELAMSISWNKGLLANTKTVELN